MELEEAVGLLLKHARPVTEREETATEHTRGRVLAEDVFASFDQPPFPRSPLDGYAVKSADIADASKEKPVTLRVLCETGAGHLTDKNVGHGEAVRIMTGAPIPDGADCIVRQEDTDYGEEQVRIYVSHVPFQNYCYAGEDFKTGDLLLEEGMYIGPAACGILAGAGRKTALVYRKPRVLLLSTGDELMEPGSPLAPAKIYDSNLYMTAAFLEECGADVIGQKLVADDAARCAETILASLKQVDLVVTTGGVSVGKHDIMHEVLERTGAEKLFWQVKLKPGSPFLSATLDEKPVLCLSGSPFGAFVTLALLVRPVVRRMARLPQLAMRQEEAVVDGSFPKPSGTRRFLRAFAADGRVKPVNGKNGNVMLSMLAGCNCLMEIPAGSPPLTGGERLKVHLF